MPLGEVLLFFFLLLGYGILDRLGLLDAGGVGDRCCLGGYGLGRYREVVVRAARLLGRDRMRIARVIALLLCSRSWSIRTGRRRLYWHYWRIPLILTSTDVVVVWLTGFVACCLNPTFRKSGRSGAGVIGAGCCCG